MCQAVDGGARKPGERTYRPGMPHADWAGVRRDLTRALGLLADREFLVLGETFSAPVARPWPGRSSPRVSGPSRYVQALRVEDVLCAECVGAVSQGGTCKMTKSAVERLRSLGWLTPAETRSAYATSTANFMLFAEHDATQPLADLMVTSLALLGATPASLVLEASTGGLRAVGD